MANRSKLAVILHADVVGSTALVQSDERIAHERIRDAFRRFAKIISTHEGTTHELRGDALVAEFPRASDAVLGAAEFQIANKNYNDDLEGAIRPVLRVGIALGEVVIADGTITGAGVVLAQRLEQLAAPGAICISAAVREALPERLAFNFQDLGEHELKGFAAPQRVCQIKVIEGDAALERKAKPGAQLTIDERSQTERPSIAVLPFLCMSEERTLDYLADGLSEDITTLLARIPGFFVISRGSAFAYKGKHTDSRQVARDLGVRYVVEGSLRPVGTDIRVTAQLIDAGADNHLWAERFNRPAERVLELQDEITQAIVSRIEPALAGAELIRLQRRAPENLDAWELYQCAHGLLVLKGWAPSTFEEAISLLRQAIAIDQDFALAHGYLSLLLALSHMFQFSTTTPPADEQASAAADKAVNLDGRDSAVLGYAGCALCDIGQSQRGVELLERAVEADPSNAQAWAALGVGLIRSRKPREGVKKLRHGILISPIDARLSYWGTILANTLFRLREYAEALKEAQTACRRNGQFANPRVVVAMILAHQGRNAEAAKSMEEAKRIFPDLSVSNVAGLIGKRGVKILAEAKLLN